MTIDEAVNHVIRIGSMGSGNINSTLRDTLAKNIEVLKKRELISYAWKFARGTLTIDFPYIHSYIEGLLLCNNNNYCEHIDDIDFVYLYKERGVAIENILLLYQYYLMKQNTDGYSYTDKHSFIFENDVEIRVHEKFNVLSNYFKYYLDLFSEDYIKYKPEVLYIINAESRFNYCPKEALESLEFEKYKQRILEITKEFKLIDLFPSIENEGNEENSLMKIEIEGVKYIKNCLVKQLKFVVDTKIECTIDKNIEKLPHNFVLLVCQLCARDKALANNEPTKANILFREYQNNLATLQNSHAEEVQDIDEIEHYQVEEKERKSLWN